MNANLPEEPLGHNYGKNTNHVVLPSHPSKSCPVFQIQLLNITEIIQNRKQKPSPIPSNIQALLRLSDLIASCPN